MQEVPVSKSSRRLTIDLELWEEIRDGNVGSEVMCIQLLAKILGVAELAQEEHVA